MQRRTLIGLGVALLLIAVALPAAAADTGSALEPDQTERYPGDCPGYTGCGHYQHQNGGGQPDEPTGDCVRDRAHLRDGSCGACPNRCR